MLADLRHLFRNLRRSPSSAVAAVLTLALTLGAGASIFSVVDAVVLTPPPVADPGSLIVLLERPTDDPSANSRPATFATFERWRERARALAAMEASDGTNLTLTGLGPAERVPAMNVTTGFLALLGAPPALGRTFGPDDEGQPVVIVSASFWRSRLGADPSAVGRRIVLGGEPHTIVGVLSEHFEFGLSSTDVWRPLPTPPGSPARAATTVGVVARLTSGHSAVDLGTVLGEVSAASTPRARVEWTPLAAAINGAARPPLMLLAGASGFALLVAFANLAGLLLVRALDRRRELAVRTALGARRFEIARQLLLEAVVIAAAGVAGGLLLAWWTTPAVGRIALEQFGALSGRSVEVSWLAIAVASAAGLTCALICGALPAFSASRPDIVHALRRGATAPPRDRRFRRLFVAGEVALAFVLLTSLALLGRNLIAVVRANPGFDAAGVTALAVSLPSARYDDARVNAFYSALQTTLDERLGARAASIVDEIPLSGGRSVVVASNAPGAAGREAMVRSAGAAYLGVMRIPVLIGRGLEASDMSATSPRAVISESLATALFPGQQAVGRRLWLRGLTAPIEIVGIAGDVKQRALDEASTPAVYLPSTQAPSNSSIIVVRANRPVSDVAAVVRGAVAKLDRDLPVYRVRTMADIVAASPGVPARRVLTAAFGAFALLAVVLATLGLFGLAAHDVARRRAEIALRIALGAEPARILRGTLTQGAWTVAAGLIAGGMLAIWSVRSLRAVFPSAGAVDVTSLAVAAGILFATGLAAVLPAAIRASRTDPLKALRAE